MKGGGWEGEREGGRKEGEKKEGRQSKAWMACGQGMQGTRSAWQTVGSNRSRSSRHIVEGPVGHNIESGFYFHCNGQSFEGFKQKGAMI